jgi:hypothetical protein
MVGEKTISTDVVQDAFASITKDVKFHVLQEQTQFFCHLLFNLYIGGSNWWMAFGCWLTLFIINRTQVDLVSQAILFHEIVATIVI